MKKLLIGALALVGLSAWAATLDAAVFAKKSVLTVSGYSGSTTLANFPVLVRLSADSPSGFSYADVTNGDLRFADADGNSLPFEIETWNPSGESHIWVSVPSLSGANTQITMYYGATSGKIPAVSSIGVWSGADYANVMHFSKANGAQSIDSTANALTIALPNTTANTLETAGLLTGAVKNESSSQLGLKVDANDAWNWADGDAVTVSVWGKRTSDTADRVLFSTTGLELSVNGATAKATVNGVSVTASIDDVSTWNLYTLVADGTSVKLYVNGVEGGSADGAVSASSDAFYWGSNGSSRWKGTFDEARLRHGVDTADWAKACYDTVANSNFVTAAAVVAQETTAPTFEDTAATGTAVEAEKFSSRIALTLSGYTGFDAIENLPVLVRLGAITASDFDVSALASDGSNFRFADAKGNNLPFEIDTWDATSGYNAWVTVPYVSGTATKIFLYFGTTATLAANDSTKVWSDAGYGSVMHFQSAKADLGAFDSTGYADEITVQSATVVSTTNGKIGEGSNNETSGATGYQFTLEDAAQWTKGDAVTFSMWASIADGQRPLFGDSTAGGVYSIYATADKNVWAVSGQKTATAAAAGVNVLSLADGVAANTWAHYTFVCEGSVTKVYVNGTYQGMVSTPLPKMTAFTWCYANGGRLKGNADESRLHHGAESADFIAASYKAMADADFITAGSVEPAVLNFKPEILKAEVSGNAAEVETRLTAFAEGASSVTMTLLYGKSAEALTSEFALGSLSEPGSGTKTLTGLDYASKYYLQVKAVDNLSNEALSEVVEITTGADPRLDASLFGYMSTIVVGGYAGETALEDFPVLVKVSANSPAGFSYENCEQDGSDIRFADENGLPIPHELEKWDTTGESVIWVKLPRISGKATSFTMYYGAAAQLPAVDATEVWTKYVTVAHGTEFKDSSPKTNEVANGGGITLATDTGVAGGYFHKEARNSVGVNVKNPYKNNLLTNKRQYTVGAWGKSSVASDTSTHIFIGNVYSWGNGGFLCVIEKGKGFSVAVSSTHQYTDGLGKLPADTWTHYAFSYDTAAGALKSYSNGEKIYESLAAKTYTDGDQSSWTFGSYANHASGDSFVGEIDEIRVYDGLASEDWVKAEYDSMANASFLTMGDAQSTSSTVPLTLRVSDVEQFGTTVCVSGRLANLGTGASKATVRLYWSTSETVDATCESVEVGEYMDKANLLGTLTGLTAAQTYYVAFCAVNDLSTPETAWSPVLSFTVDASTKLGEVTVTKSNCKATIVAEITDWGAGSTTFQLLLGSSAENLEVVQTKGPFTEEPAGGVVAFDPMTLPVGTYIYVVRALTTYGESVWTKETPTSNTMTLADTATYTWKGGTGLWSDTSKWTTEEEGSAGCPSSGCSVVFPDGDSDVTLATGIELKNITISSVGTHAFRTTDPQKICGIGLTSGGHLAIDGNGGGTLIYDSVTSSAMIENTAGLGQVVIVNRGSLFPGSSPETDITLVNGGNLYNGGAPLQFGKLRVVGGPCVVSVSQYTQHGFTFASFEAVEGTGLPVVSVKDGRVTFTDPSGIETVGGTATLADATSTIPVCPNFQIGAVKLNDSMHGKGACTIENGVIRAIPAETMKDTLVGATETDNVRLSADFTLEEDVTVNALIFEGAKINLGGHVVTVRSGVFREGDGGMWNNVISNGSIRLCRPLAIGDNTNNPDVRCRVDFFTEGNDDPNKCMIAHNCQGGGWDTYAVYTNFTGRFAAPPGTAWPFNSKMRNPNVVVEMRGGALQPVTHYEKAVFKGLTGFGRTSFGNWSTLFWLGDCDEDDQEYFASATGRIVIGKGGFFAPGYIDYDGARRGKFSVNYELPQGTLPKLDTLEFRSGARLSVTVRKDGSCSFVDASARGSDGNSLAVQLAGTLDVNPIGRVRAGQTFPVLVYRDGMRSGKFDGVTRGFRVTYDVPQDDGTVAVTVTKKGDGFFVLIR